MTTYDSITQIQADLQSGKTSCVKIVEQYLAAIKAKAQLNAFLETYEQEALQKAQETDEKLANNQALGKLFGCVVGVKDVICQKGKKVTAASKILEDFESLYTATALQKLIDEDAIIIGRLNCDEFAMGSSNEHSYYGATLNAQDTNCVPGGSSGGSAVAVQAGLCTVALGSDTGGSVRQPASFCGTVGFKPSYGRISRHGLLAYASSFDQIGVLAHNVNDAALVSQLMCGKDEFDSTLVDLPTANFISDTPKPSKSPSNKKYKLAYFKEAVEHPSIDVDIQEAFYHQFKKLEEQGHTVSPISFKELEYLVPTYYILTAAEASSNLGRYDGVHFGWRHPKAKSLNDVYEMTRTEGFGKEVKRRIILGTFVLSSGYYDAYYTKAQKIRRIVQSKTLDILKDYDFIVGPTTPSTAFELGAKSKQDPTQMYLADIFTVHANLAGLPAISLPLFNHPKNDMPFGFQLMGNAFAEKEMFDFCASL